MPEFKIILSEDPQNANVAAQAAARAAAYTGGGVAGGRLAGAAAGAAGILAGGSRAMGAMGVPGAMLAAAGQVGGAVNQLAGTAAGFSPDVARAQASADVRSTRAEMREAQELGPALGKFIDAQSRASDELSRILLPIKKVIVEVLAKGMEIVVDLLKGLHKLTIAVWETLKAGFESLTAAITFQWGDLEGIWEGLPARIERAVRDGMREADVQDVLMGDLARFEVPWMDWTAEGRAWMAGGRVGPRPPEELEPNMALR